MGRTRTTTKNVSTIKLTKRGAFLINTGPTGDVSRTKIAEPVRVRAIGEDEDGVTIAQIRFRTRCGARQEFFPFSTLLPENSSEIKNKLADRGYEWPRDAKLSSDILAALNKSPLKREFIAVRAPGWYGPAYVIPGQAFGAGASKPEVFINDRDSDAHVGAFVVGRGSLRDWQQFVAKPSGKSSRLRLSIAAALAAPFLRPLNMDSFGINWFSNTSDGKTACLVVAVSVAGLVGNEGLPCWADSTPGMEDLARGHRDNVMPLDESADGEYQLSLAKKSRMIAFLIEKKSSSQTIQEIRARPQDCEP
jgi:uncharacterized protein (DUF927 family)